MNGRAGFGRTYGATLEAAIEAAARGGVLGQVGFDRNEDAVGAVVAFERLRRVLARHVRLLVGPAWPNQPGRRDLVAEELASALEAAVRPVVSGLAQAFAGRHPAEQVWRTSADALGLAHDILASHLDPDRAALTPDGELALRPEAAWPAVVRLADLALTLDRQRDCLVRRLADAGRTRTLSGLPSVHMARLGTARVQRTAAKVIETASGRPGSLALDEIAPAPVKSAILLPEDPVDRALARQLGPSPGAESQPAGAGVPLRRAISQVPVQGQRRLVAERHHPARLRGPGTGPLQRHDPGRVVGQVKSVTRLVWARKNRTNSSVINCRGDGWATGAQHAAGGSRSGGRPPGGAGRVPAARCAAAAGRGRVGDGGKRTGGGRRRRPAHGDSLWSLARQH